MGRRGTPRGAGTRAWREERAFGAAVVLLSIPANVYRGVHWPTNMIGGLFLGAALAAAALALEARRAPG